MAGICNPCFSFLFQALFIHFSFAGLEVEWNGGKCLVQHTESLGKLVTHSTFPFPITKSSFHWESFLLVLSSDNMEDTLRQTMNLLYLPFLCSYSQGLLVPLCGWSFLSGILSLPRAILFMDNCLIADLSRGMDAGDPTPPL